MSRIQATDIKDELIGPLVEADDLAKTDAYLDDLANALEVDPATIVDPLPFKVKELAVAYTCQEIAKRKAGGLAGAGFKNQDSGDKYQAKLAIFQADVQRLESLITGDILTGIRKSAAVVGTIELERG